jgi:signal transduction histidine kinase
MMDLFIQEVDIKEILASTIGVAKGLVRETPIELVEEIEEDIPHTYGDKRRLRQVVLNLVSNAVKFTQEGNVTVGARCENGSIHLSVTDTGIGIAPEDRHLVFESFKQVKHGLSMVGGTGLGMPITKYFVESHRGEIWFESKAGIGTTFHVRLPVLTEEEALAMNQEMRPEPVVS